jgi:hypothetical protein
MKATAIRTVGLKRLTIKLALRDLFDIPVP